MGSCSAREIVRLLNMPVSTVHKILRNILHWYPFVITHVQQLHATDLLIRQTFAVDILALMEVDNLWPRNILRTDESRFHLQCYANSHNRRIWETKNAFKLVPVLSATITVWHVIATSFMLRQIRDFEQIGPANSVTCTVNFESYETVLSNNVISTVCMYGQYNFQARLRFSTHCKISEAAAQMHFGNNRIISRHFPTAQSLRSPDLNS